jgi:MarR family transcriptional regulator, 2-MHQ and catechol-resistance regulon repressor
LDERSKKELADGIQESIGTIMRATAAIFRGDAERYGITGPQFGMFKVVQARGPMTITELSRRMMIAAPTASRMIDGLCENGLLAKSRSESDSRVTMVSLTGESERQLRHLGQVHRRAIEEAFEGEPRENLNNLVEFMSKLAERLAARAPRACGREKQENR